MSDTPLITENDRKRSRTARSITDVLRALEIAEGTSGPMLDVGCGYGGLPAMIGLELNIAEVHGVDLDRTVLAEARSKGVEALLADARDPLPYGDGYFGLVTSFGMLDYLVTFDDALGEFHRVMRPGGTLIVSLPNLAAWHNRLALAAGYQLRDVECSRYVVPGTAPYYRRRGLLKPTGHLHALTIQAFKGIAYNAGFTHVGVIGSAPVNTRTGGRLDRVDRFVARNRPTLAKRFIYVGRRPG